MGERKDFFVSYTGIDRRWAEWIAWQLEAEGYDIVVQAWDFSPGNDWAHEMQRAASTADRVIAVLSPEYMHSRHGEAEWRVFYARDPTGEEARLLPVRVREVDPPGLLMTKIYVDLVGRDAATGRDLLLAAARGARGKPAAEPEFPGREQRARHDPAAPAFPADRVTIERAEPIPPSVSAAMLRAGDVGALHAYLTRVAAWLERRGYSADDLQAFEISIRELVNNVADHVSPHDTVRFELEHQPPEPFTYHEGVAVTVVDGGEGFNFDRALRASETELEHEPHVEHGLLRAYRLGSLLFQASTDPHVMLWARERVPQTVPSIFRGDEVVPLIVSYTHQAVRISKTVHTFFQFERYLLRSQAFLDLIFDPLLRPARPLVGIAFVGQGWTGSLSWRKVLDPLLEFVERTERFDKELLLFADRAAPIPRVLRRSRHPNVRGRGERHERRVGRRRPGAQVRAAADRLAKELARLAPGRRPTRPEQPYSCAD
jgi:anti-sigma regulatory factor (Ser/Thr protein kinase)